MQKNINEKTRNTKGTRSQPSRRSVARNATSIGNVTQRSVIITRRGEGEGGGGGLSRSSVEISGSPFMANVSACRAVDRRETNIEPTLPGKPAAWSVNI